MTSPAACNPCHSIRSCPKDPYGSYPPFLDLIETPWGEENTASRRIGFRPPEGQVCSALFNRHLHLRVHDLGWMPGLVRDIPRQRGHMAETPLNQRACLTKTQMGLTETEIVAYSVAEVGVGVKRSRPPPPAPARRPPPGMASRTRRPPPPGGRASRSRRWSPG